MKRWQYLLGIPVVLILVLQLVPNELPSVESDNPGDLIGSGIISDDVAQLLKTACYDCHSNEPSYPWYAHVAPTSWLVSRDVREAREELNFSNWENYDLIDQIGKLDDIYSEVEEGKMPLGIYTIMHPSAKLSEEQRQAIVSWAEEAMDIIAESEEE